MSVSCFESHASNHFGRNRKLKSEKEIKLLFSHGKSIGKFPIKFIWRINSNTAEVPTKVVFSVPKKKFKRAVDRNRIKRLLFEAFRQNCTELDTYLIKSDQQMDIFILFLGDELPDFKSVESKIILSLKRLLTELMTNYNRT